MEIAGFKVTVMIRVAAEMLVTALLLTKAAVLVLGVWEFVEVAAIKVVVKIWVAAVLLMTAFFLMTVAVLRLVVSLAMARGRAGKWQSPKQPLAGS